MSISIFLMTQKGYEVLNAIINNNLNESIDLIIVGKDKNIEKDYFEEIKLLCKENNINCVENSKNITIKSNYVIAISWKWLIPVNSDFKLIIIHDSLLPKYRGFSPLVNSLINGEEYIGITAIFASNEYDRGEVIYQEKQKVIYPIKIKMAIDLISILYSNLVVKIINQINDKIELTSYVQIESDATYSLWRDEDDYEINWNMNSEYIKRFIDSVGFPFKGAKSYLEGKIVRILDSEIVPDVNIENRDVGKIIFMQNQLPVIVCGTGLLKITNIVDENNNNLLPFTKFRLKFKNI